MSRKKLEYTGELFATPLTAIVGKCMDCTCDQKQEIRVCHITSCPLWPYRNGKNPYKLKPNHPLTPEQKEKVKAHMEMMHEARRGMKKTNNKESNL